MKIGDRIYNKKTNLPSYISDIMGHIIWVKNDLYKNIFNPYSKSDFINLYMTEKELRKQKLLKINKNYE